jgi:hypothetical protein
MHALCTIVCHDRMSGDVKHTIQQLHAVGGLISTKLRESWYKQTWKTTTTLILRQKCGINERNDSN